MDRLKWWQRGVLSENLPPSRCSKLAKEAPSSGRSSGDPSVGHPGWLSKIRKTIGSMDGFTASKPDTVDDIEFCSGQATFRDICFFGVPRGGFHQHFPTMFKHIPRFSTIFPDFPRSSNIFTKIFQDFHPPSSPHRWKETPIFGPALRDDRNADRALDANKLCADTRLARWPVRSTWFRSTRFSGEFQGVKRVIFVGKMSLKCGPPQL